ncbi:MAG TPA: Fic family protein [Pseudonocardiaceae bacterium]|jgi:Fic family protein|nr:Fic family protein [Pseudonocardiaceae bacterium]
MSDHAYLRSHPWITFLFDLRKLDYQTWLLFGEAESKCEHVAGAPLSPDVARRLHQVYLSKGIHGTTSIEGNTLSEDEVLARVQGELELPVSREYLGREIDNIVRVCNEIIRDVVDGRPLRLDTDRIAEFNRRILEGLPLRDGVVPGKVREDSVVVARYRGAPARDCAYLLNRLCEWLENMRPPDDNKELAFTFAVLKSILAHLYIAWIHPFGDGNGRTARLIEFQLMIQAGIPIPSAHLLSDHYNRTREVYYIELDRTSKGSYPVEGFIKYAMQGFVDELREQIAEIRHQQMSVTWENYVHDLFSGQDTPAKARQRALVLALPTTPVPRSKIREVSPRIAEAYAGKTRKTVSRDLNALEGMGLVTHVRGGILANRSIVEAFLPIKADS